MKKPKRRRIGKNAAWVAEKAKEKTALHKQTLASGGFKERLEALYGIRKDAK